MLDLLHPSNPMDSGWFLGSASSDEVNLPLGLLLLHPVEEGEEQVRVGRSYRPLSPTMIKGCLCVLSCHLRGNPVQLTATRRTKNTQHILFDKKNSV